jgi:hypothetical protein
MNSDTAALPARAVGVLLAALTLGTLVAVGYAASRPRRRSKRLVNRLDRRMHELEQRLRAA